MEERTISIAQLREVIKHLPEDEPQNIEGKWYQTQKEHWLGWLSGYRGPGAYGRKNWHRDARFVYNHVVCPGLLMYLIHSIGLPIDIVEKAEEASTRGNTEMATSGAIRKIVPWEMVYQSIWGRQGEKETKKLRITLLSKVWGRIASHDPGTARKEH